MARTVSSTTSRDGDGQPATGNYHAHALARGLGILEELAGAGHPLNLSDLGELTGMPKSTLVRLLSVLNELEYVVRVDEQPTFRLGHKVEQLSRAYESELDIRSLAGRYLREVAEATGHTCNLGVLDGDKVLHICVEQPDRPLRFNSAPGSRDHVYCTGLGKLLLSALPESEVEEVLPPEPWRQVTESTLVSRAALMHDLRRIRSRGYAVDDNERSSGLRCVAVGIAAGGSTNAAVSLSGPSAEFTVARQKEYAKVLAELASDLAANRDFAIAIQRLAGWL